MNAAVLVNAVDHNRQEYLLACGLAVLYGHFSVLYGRSSVLYGHFSVLYGHRTLRTGALTLALEGVKTP